MTTATEKPLMPNGSQWKLTAVRHRDGATSKRHTVSTVKGTEGHTVTLTGGLTITGPPIVGDNGSMTFDTGEAAYTFTPFVSYVEPERKAISRPALSKLMAPGTRWALDVITNDQEEYEDCGDRTVQASSPRKIVSKTERGLSFLDFHKGDKQFTDDLGRLYCVSPSYGSTARYTPLEGTA